MFRGTSIENVLMCQLANIVSQAFGLKGNGFKRAPQDWDLYREIVQTTAVELFITECTHHAASRVTDPYYGVSCLKIQALVGPLTPSSYHGRAYVKLEGRT